MKKFLKYFIISFTIILAIILINCIRNFIIIKKIFNLGDNFTVCNNYKITENIKTDLSEIKTSYYCKDNIHLLESTTYFANESTYNIVWYDESNNDFISLTKDENENLIEDNSITSIESLLTIEDYIFSKPFDNYISIFSKNIFCIIVSEDNCYKIKSPTNSSEYFYINKETGLIQKLTNSYSYLEFIYTINTVKDSDIIKPSV